MRWTIHIEGGPRRVNHAAVCVGDKIYSFGGYCSTEEYKDWEPIPVHVLDTYSLRWSVVNYKKEEIVPFQRYGHTTVAYKNKVFMWGGRNNAVACDTLTCFDINTLEWSTPNVSGMVPYAKDGHSACVINNKMYIFGGFDYHTDQYSQEVHYLDLDKLQWKFVHATGEVPCHRDFHTAVAYGNRMYVFGGRGDVSNSSFTTDEEVYCPELFYLDIVEEKWYKIIPYGKEPQGRRSHSAWLYNNEMYIFGGYNGNAKVHFNDLHKYSIEENKCPCPHMCSKHVTQSDDNPERLVDNSDLHILDFSPTLETLAIVAVLNNNLDQSCLPQTILLKKRRHIGWRAVCFVLAGSGGRARGVPIDSASKAAPRPEELYKIRSDRTRLSVFSSQ
ncbi:Kelch domain-containing protein 3 [Eumeta japonica]|uniref:Kelch domain-containing protein 3 n=1 Tax=Eumeta variegata TaxID=151549 RepID=A0A4C1UYV8_EUMVA|nr:Kelch domain-containing protein 3 [Eumeta japonica]